MLATISNYLLHTRMYTKHCTYTYFSPIQRIYERELHWFPNRQLPTTILSLSFSFCKKDNSKHKKKIICLP